MTGVPPQGGRPRPLAAARRHTRGPIGLRPGGAAAGAQLQGPKPCFASSQRPRSLGLSHGGAVADRSRRRRSSVDGGSNQKRGGACTCAP
jgi:hypothetical protein